MSGAPAKESKPRLGGLSLLEWLRPPSGYVTDCALGTTYSLDLVTCTAALVSLNGAARDKADFSLTATLRAMHALAGRVCVLTQQGCIHWRPGTRSAVLPLLDRVVRSVPFSLSERAFHPKVWVVRQVPVGTPSSEARYVLVIGSRNLTCDVAWDLGVALEGVACPGRNTNLLGADGVLDFARFACSEAGIPEFAERLHDVRSVQWELPDDVRQVTFGFHGKKKLAWAETGLALLPGDVRQMLILSPFLDMTAVKQAASRFRDVDERRIVSGAPDLDKVSAVDTQGALEQLNPRSMDVVRDEPARRSGEDLLDYDDQRPAPSVEDAEMVDESRGLHAKVIALSHPKGRASVLVGSPNLTTRGWCGANCEAWVLLEGKSSLFDPLWQWSGDVASEYHAPTRPDRFEPDDGDLDRAHHYVSARSYRLYEHGPVERARLEADQPPLVPGLARVELRVARLSQPTIAVRWPPGNAAIELPGCDPSERTDLLLFTLREGEGSDAVARSWVQQARVEPQIDEQRDGALLRRVLGPARFLEYLRGYLDPAAADADDEPVSRASDGAGGGGGSAGRAPLGIRLEALLRAFARDSGASVGPLRKAILQYRSFASEEDDELRELWELWAAVEEVYGR